MSVSDPLVGSQPNPIRRPLSLTGSRGGVSVFVSEHDELVGASGVLTVGFVGPAQGSTGLRFDYERPFEEGEPEDTFTLDVTVG